MKSFQEKNERILILFDMDLFKPSYFCLSKIASFLKKGDLLYFDESFDPDEFSLVHFFIKLDPGKYNFRN